MTTKYSQERSEEVGRFSVGADAEVTVQIAERDGRQFIVIKEQHPDDAASTMEHAVEIPVTLLPELKRAIAALEESVVREGESVQPSINFAHDS